MFSYSASVMEEHRWAAELTLWIRHSPIMEASLVLREGWVLVCYLLKFSTIYTDDYVIIDESSELKYCVDKVNLT